jgi:phenylacetate-CoA ligase
LSDGNIKYYVQKLEKSRIKYIVGYPSSINEIATWILRNNQNFQLRLKAIFTNAEPLTISQRENIGEAFKCKIIQTYGSSEFALAASETEEGQMKIWPQSGILEILNPDENGLGEFLITGLVNNAMPLIRYRLGDSGVIKTSEAIPSTIEKIEGRTDDLIRTPDGRAIGRLDPIFKKELKIREAQVVQAKIDRLVFRIVRDEGYTKLDEQKLNIEAKKRFGNEIKIDFEYVPYIERTKNGKFKAVVSLLR